MFDRYYRRNNTLVLNAINTDSKGNVIMVAMVQDSTSTGSWDNDLYILKVDSNGNFNPVGLKEVDRIDPLNYAIFPNPAKDQLTFRQFNLKESYQMNLFDQQGRLVKQYHFNQFDNQFELSNVPNGIYVYQLTDSKGRGGSGKIVKQ